MTPLANNYTLVNSQLTPPELIWEYRFPGIVACVCAYWRVTLLHNIIHGLFSSITLSSFAKWRCVLVAVKSTSDWKGSSYFAITQTSFTKLCHPRSYKIDRPIKPESCHELIGYSISYWQSSSYARLNRFTKPRSVNLLFSIVNSDKKRRVEFELWGNI